MSDATRGRMRLELGSIGLSGLRNYGGFIREEWLPELATPQQQIRHYMEMRDSESVVWAWYWLVTTLVRGVDWKLAPPDDAEKGDIAAMQELIDFGHEVMADMEHSWDDAVDEANSKLLFGWSLQEKVFKIRRGPGRDPRTRSMFNDGRIGIRKLKLLGQDTLLRWGYDEQEDPISIHQISYTGEPPTEVPLAKCVHHRTTKHKGNPEGRSILRSAYRSWYMLRNIEEIEAIGIERDAVGYPYIRVPAELLMDNCPPEMVGLRNALQQMVTNIRRDELEGALLPFDPANPDQYKLELLKGGGQRQIDIDKVVERYRTNIALSLMTDFLKLGHTARGTQALSESKIGYFAAVVNGQLTTMAEEYTNQLFIPLWRLNGWDLPVYPKLVASDVNFRDVTEKATVVADLAKSGVLPAQVYEIVNAILRDLGLPELDLAKLQLQVEPSPVGMGRGAQPQNADDAQAEAEQGGAAGGGGEKEGEPGGQPAGATGGAQ